MPIRVKIGAVALMVLALVGGCGKVESTATSIPPTATLVLPTPTPIPSQTPVPPTETSTATPTQTPVPPTETPTATSLPPTETATPLPTATATKAPPVTISLESGFRAEARTYGGNRNDWGYDILLLDDGGTLIVGQADNTGISHRIFPGKAHAIRTDAQGDVVWEKDYGGEVDSLFYSPIQTGDDEYVILGQIAASYTRDEEDMYLVKIDGEGNEIWSQTYGGRGMDTGKMVRQTADGGFIVVGDRADEFPSEGLYQSNLILIKTDAQGNELWSHTYGNKILYLGWGVVQTPDGGYVLTGWEAKTIPDRDVIVIKTDEQGEVEWSRTWDLDPGDRDGGFDMILTADDHIVIAGIRSMDDGPRGAILIKVDLEGNEVWVKEYDAGGEGCEFWDIMEDANGGYVMAGGRFLSFDQRTGEAVREGFIVKTDPDGEVLWQHTVSSDEYESILLSSAVVLPGRGYIFVGAATPRGSRYWDMLRLEVTADETPIPTPEPLARADVKTFGGPDGDIAYGILLTADGGTLISGSANNKQIHGHGNIDGNARLIKTDLEGEPIWEKDYGGQAPAAFFAMIQAAEGEYVLLGDKSSSDAGGNTDLYLVQVDEEGNEIWSHTYGTSSAEFGRSVRQTADGGYILIGSTTSVPDTYASIYLVKTDALGNEVWSRAYSDQFVHQGWDVTQMPDGGYIFAGFSAPDHDARDILAMKIDGGGDVEWSRTWDFGGLDEGFGIALASDGNVVISGVASLGSPTSNIVLLKVDPQGNEIWNKTVGGPGSAAWHLTAMPDGGYILGGRIGSDALMLKADAEGQVLWQHTLGAEEFVDAFVGPAVLLPEGGYLFAGGATRHGNKNPDMLWLKATGESQVIAFNSERDGNSEIYVMTITGGPGADGADQGLPVLRRLTDDPAYDAWPTWSPDGSQIAFMSDRSGNPDIFVMDADGGNLRQLTDHPANDIWPEWSPDGKRIAFPSRRDGNFELYVMDIGDGPDADDSNLQRLTNTPGHEDFPAWSPDGRQLVFSRIEDDEGTYVLDVDGAEPGSGNERQLLDFPVLEPAWSPDGTRIAFGSDHEGFRAIYVIDADGGGLRRLSSTRAGENCPTWSPDGRRIAFASWRDGDGEIYVMDGDGNNLQKLTNNRFEDEFPAWRPKFPPHDGSRANPLIMTYGGPHNDRAFDVLALEDGGLLIAGLANNTAQSHGIVPGSAQVIRTDAGDSILWEKEYGGEKDASLSSIIQAGEDEYLLLGEIAASYVRGETDLYLVKIDGQGEELWSRTFGGRGMNYGKMVRQTADGGYILVGGQMDEEPTNYVYESNIHLIKTDAEGNEIWSRLYGDQVLYLGWGVAQTADGGYVLAGWGAGTYNDRDVILIKTDGAGGVEWSRTWDLAPGERDGGFDLILTADGYVVMACIQAMGSGRPSAVLIKVDLEGNEIWNKLIGEEGVGNTLWHIMEDADGGYVLAGDTHLGRVPGTGREGHGAWLVKTDQDGEILWQQIFGEGKYDQAHFHAGALLPAGGYVLVGDVTLQGESNSDMLWLKLATGGQGRIHPSCLATCSLFEYNISEQCDRKIHFRSECGLAMITQSAAYGRQGLDRQGYESGIPQIGD